MKKLMGVSLVLAGLVCFVMIIFRIVMFNIDCGGHMELAAKANSISLAQQEMRMVVKYLEDHNLTKGNTAVLWNTPQQDLNFFYNNMKASLEELERIEDDSSSLDKSNVLMKLRETLTETSGKGSEKMCVPFGITRAPHQVLFIIWAVISAVMLVVGVITFLIGLENDRRW